MGFGALDNSLKWCTLATLIALHIRFNSGECSY